MSYIHTFGHRDFVFVKDEMYMHSISMNHERLPLQNHVSLISSGEASENGRVV